MKKKILLSGIGLGTLSTLLGLLAIINTPGVGEAGLLNYAQTTYKLVMSATVIGFLSILTLITGAVFPRE